MLGRDDRAEGVPEQREAVEPERLGEQVDVAGEDLERERRRIDALAAPLSALVDVEQPELVAERVEVRPEHGVVEPGPAVQHDQREAGADLLDEETDSVREPHCLVEIHHWLPQGSSTAYRRSPKSVSCSSMTLVAPASSARR